MKLKFISEDALRDLRTNYETYKIHYYNNMNDEFFEDFFKKEGYVIDSKIEIDMPVFHQGEDYMISDSENVKRMHTALKHLTIAQATQERIWAGLAHIQMRDFMKYRLQQHLVEKVDKRIQSAIFFTNGSKRSLFVNMLSRLWWVGHMTYDENNQSNPYELTEFFCAKDFSARAVVFFSSNFTSNTAITRGIIKAIMKLESIGINVIREHFVEANRYLNVLGGAMVLDMLEESEVEEIILERLKSHFLTPIQVAVSTNSQK